VPGLIKQLSDYFNLSRTERRGLVVLIGLLLLVLVAEIFIPVIFKEKKVDLSRQKAEVEEFLAEQSKLKDLEYSSTRASMATASENEIVENLFYFDPNNLPKEKWLELGLTEKQIKIIKNYESAGGKFKTANDLAKIYSIDTRDYQRLKPWIVIAKTDKKKTEASQILNLHTFDPNLANEQEMLDMGINSGVVSNIINYRNKGGFFKNPKDVNRLYTINDSLFALLHPFIVITPKEIATPDSTNLTSFETILEIDINSADTLDLQQLKGIGPAFARRIVKYRELLGGYSTKDQLLEVYGMDSIRFALIAPNVVISTGEITKININIAGVKDLIKHPYIEFYLAKSIIRHREKVGRFKSLDEVLDAKLVYKELFEKIKPYLTI